MLRPEIAALTMSGSSLIVAVNALLLKRLDLPSPAGNGRPGDGSSPGQAPWTSMAPSPSNPKVTLPPATTGTGAVSPPEKMT